MSTISTAITTIDSSDTLSASRDVINTNFALRHSMTVRSIDDADSPYTLADGDDVILVTSTSSAVDINLGPAGEFANRTVLIILRYELGGASTISAQVGESINGASTTTLTNRYDCCRLLSDGSEWYIISAMP